MQMLHFPPCFSISLYRNIEWGPGKKVASNKVAKYATDKIRHAKNIFSGIIFKIILKIISEKYFSRDLKMSVAYLATFFDATFSPDPIQCYDIAIC